jgi:hypothetical protein
LTEDGFGLVSFIGPKGKVKNSLAHNQVWIKAHGPKPKGMWVIQSCGNRLCLNLEHLVLGTKEQFQEVFPHWVSLWQVPPRKVTEEQVLEIKQSTEHVERLSERYGISVGYVKRLRSNKS